jgi:replication factor C small subunit
MKELKRIKIKSIKKLEEKRHVYDISVEGNHNFFIGESETLTHNCDYMNPLSQAMLRNLMETFSDRTRFILTCNYVEKIIDPIQSRCQSFKIEPPSKKDIALHMVDICKKENLEFIPSDIKLIIDKSYPDIRKTLGMLQQSISNGKINIDGLSFTQSGFEDNVIELLKSNESIKNRFTSIRKLMMDEGLNDYSSFFNILYTRIDDYGQGNVASLILAINEAQYKSAFTVDGEINAMALIIKILEIID